MYVHNAILLSHSTNNRLGCYNILGFGVRTYKATQVLYTHTLNVLKVSDFNQENVLLFRLQMP